MNIIDLYIKHKNNTTFGASALCAIGLLMSGWYLLIPVFVIGWYTYFLIWQVKRQGQDIADTRYWYPSTKILKEIVPQIFIRLEEMGYGKGDYEKDLNDCDDFERAGRVVAHQLFIERKDELGIDGAIPVFPLSFERDNGKRHRLFYIIDNKGDKHYVENYPVFDKYHSADGFYRILSKYELRNGYVVLRA